MSIEKEIFVSVDVEASGPIPGKYSMLSIGACVAFDPSLHFSCYLKPISDEFIPEAMEVTGLSLEQLQKEGLEPIEAMKQFKNWVNSLVKNDETVVLLVLMLHLTGVLSIIIFIHFWGGIHLALRLWISNRCTSEQPRFPGKRHVPVKSRKLSSQKVLETMMHCMMRDTRQSFFA